ncbi:hypothetical protein [Gluconobacter oxydans]|uniref:Uncharacterized protein n=1 Tax=Gluconobacter oxydans TaxID=442 RepID=A0A149S8C9_GLUOY|nr:hypothetical protein [Gluconobacter oxydans]KXV22997.1 hypothetical protein AD934_00740 [Gluconobacter oxydans]
MQKAVKVVGEWRAVQSGRVIPSGNLELNDGFLGLSSYPDAAAAGTTQTNANSLDQPFVVCTSAAARAGLRLPSYSGIGAETVVFNRSGNPILIYLLPGGQIEGLGTNAGFSLGNTASGRFVRVSSDLSGGQWYVMS